MSYLSLRVYCRCDCKRTLYSVTMPLDAKLRTVLARGILNVGMASSAGGDAHGNVNPPGMILVSRTIRT